MILKPKNFRSINRHKLPERLISLECTVNGMHSNKEKIFFFYDSLFSLFQLTPLHLVRASVDSKVVSRVAASLIDGIRIIVGNDSAEVPNVAIRSLNINQDIALKIDLNSGLSSGSTEPTEPATAGAVVRVNKQPASRELFAVERRADGTYRFAGSTLISQSGDLEMQVTGGEVYAIAVDDFGIPYQSGLDLEVGQTVRPTHFQGWLYVCTEPGKLPTTEPDWWPEIGDNPARPVGTARLQATRYYQPIAHGPINYELI